MSKTTTLQVEVRGDQQPKAAQRRSQTAFERGCARGDFAARRECV